MKLMKIACCTRCLQTVQTPGKPGHLIFHRPDYLAFNINDIENEKKHSMSMFLQNPDNEKFFN